jgi:hypothetical protein
MRMELKILPLSLLAGEAIPSVREEGQCAVAFSGAAASANDAAADYFDD